MTIRVDGTVYPTVKDFARLFDVAPKTVQDWIKKGVIPQPPIVSKGIKRIQVFPTEYVSDARQALKMRDPK